jgi:hypothetical protein
MLFTTTVSTQSFTFCQKAVAPWWNMAVFEGLYASWATNLEYPSGVRERIRPLQVLSGYNF